MKQRQTCLHICSRHITTRPVWSLRISSKSCQPHSAPLFWILYQSAKAIQWTLLCKCWLLCVFTNSQYPAEAQMSQFVNKRLPSLFLLSDCQEAGNQPRLVLLGNSSCWRVSSAPLRDPWFIIPEFNGEETVYWHLLANRDFRFVSPRL